MKHELLACDGAKGPPETRTDSWLVPYPQSCMQPTAFTRESGVCVSSLAGKVDSKDFVLGRDQIWLLQPAWESACLEYLGALCPAAGLCL